MITTIQTNKYQFWQKFATVVLLFVFNFAVINFALAQTSTAGEKMVLQNSVFPGEWAVIFLWGINAVLSAVLYFLAVLLRMTGALFDTAFAFNFTGFQDNMTIIKAGWTISRDVANIFFIFILLFIAIATILRLGSYSAKNLLPKLIIIALIINFSMVIGMVIIDFTNILSRGFYDALLADSTDGIGGVLMRAAGMSNIFNFSDATANSGWRGGIIGGIVDGLGSGVIPAGAIRALTNALVTIGRWLSLGNSLDLESGQKYFYTVMMLNILALPMAFVFVIGGVLLIMRFALLSFMLILSPIAFLAYILPDTEGRIWKKWWDVFLNNAFFMPAFMFLLYMAIFIVNAWTLRMAGANVQLNPNFIATMIASIVFLIASVVISKQMGIYGAQKVLQAATKARQYATGYTGALALRNTTGRIGEALGRQEWVKGNYYASRAAKGMAGYSGKGIFARPGKSRSEITSKRAEFDAAATKNKAMSEQIKDLTTNPNMASREKIAGEILADPKRLEEYMKNSDKGQKGELLRWARLKGGVGAEKAVKGAEMKFERDQAKAAGTSITDFMKTQTADQQKAHFKAMVNAEKTDWMAESVSDKAKTGELVNFAKTELNADEQERFFSDSARKTLKDIDNVSKAFDDLPEEMKKSIQNIFSKDEFNKIAGNVKDKNKFYDDVIKHTPNRKDELEAAMPTTAINKGGSAAKIIPMINMKMVSATEITPKIKEFVNNASSQQLREGSVRKDVAPELKKELSTIYSSANSSIAKKERETARIEKENAAKEREAAAGKDAAKEREAARREREWADKEKTAIAKEKVAFAQEAEDFAQKLEVRGNLDVGKWVRSKPEQALIALGLK